MISLLLSGYGQAEEEKSAERQASVERGQALVVALSKQDYKQTDRLLEAGADPNSRDEEGGTPLLYAARHGEAEWVRTPAGSRRRSQRAKARRSDAVDVRGARRARESRGLADKRRGGPERAR